MLCLRRSKEARRLQREGQSCTKDEPHERAGFGCSPPQQQPQRGPKNAHFLVGGSPTPAHRARLLSYPWGSPERVTKAEVPRPTGCAPPAPHHLAPQGRWLCVSWQGSGCLDPQHLRRNPQRVLAAGWPPGDGST